MNIDTIPADLKARQRWIGWQWADQVHATTGEIKRTKVPVGLWREARHWHTLDGALRHAERAQAAGVGYVLAASDGLVGVDLDHCRDPQTGRLTLFAWCVVHALHSYTEATPSGTGLHVLCRGTKPGPRCQHKAPGRELEMYETGRWFTVTGHRLLSLPATLTDATGALAALYRHLWPPAPPAPPPRPVASPTLTDTAILAIASRARNGAKFRALMRGDTTGYASESEADLALLGLLAFYTQDAAQLARLFAASRLCDAKWTARADYRRRSVDRVLARPGARFGATR